MRLINIVNNRKATNHDRLSSKNGRTGLLLTRDRVSRLRATLWLECDYRNLQFKERAETKNLKTRLSDFPYISMYTMYSHDRKK